MQAKNDGGRITAIFRGGLEMTVGKKKIYIYMGECGCEDFCFAC